MSQDLFAHQPLVDRYLKLTSARLSAFSFVNIFIWQDFFKFDFEEIDGNLCIFATDDLGTFLYLPPLGPNVSERAVHAAFERMSRGNKGKGITRIDNVPESFLDSFSRERYKVRERGYEYFYARQDIAQFQGHAFKSKRNAYNHFVKHYTARYRPYESSMLESCMELYKRWSDHKKQTSQDEVYLQMLDENAVVHRRALEHGYKLDLVGRVVEVDGKIVAYTFGYFINPQTFCDLFEVADTHYKGLTSYIFSEFAGDHALTGVEWINVMDDFAMENVAKTKMSFRPGNLVPVYTVSLP